MEHAVASVKERYAELQVRWSVASSCTEEEETFLTAKWSFAKETSNLQIYRNIVKNKIIM